MNSPIDCIPKTEWDRLIGSIIKPYLHFGPAMQDDLYQEAWVALLIAAEHFDPNRGTKFTTYASYYIRGRLLRFLSKQFNSSPSIDIEDDLGGSYVDLTAESNEFFESIMNKLKDHKHAYLLREYFVEGKTLRDLGQRHGVSAQMINNRLRKLIESLQYRLSYENT